MTIYEWLKQFSIAERVKLAEQLKVTPSYLNYLVSKKSHCSINLAHSIFNSRFNKRQPERLKWREKDYVAFRVAKLSVRRGE